MGDGTAELIAWNANPTVIESDGGEAPGVGAIVRALEFAANRGSVLVGKPGRIYFATAWQRLGLEPEELTVISDDPLGDLAEARKLGLNTIFVLSGQFKDPRIIEALPEDRRPHQLFDSIIDVPLTRG